MPSKLNRRDQAAYEAALTPDRSAVATAARAGARPDTLVPMAQAQRPPTVTRASTGRPARPLGATPAIGAPRVGTRTGDPGAGYRTGAAAFTPARNDVPAGAGSLAAALKRNRRPGYTSVGSSAYRG